MPLPCDYKFSLFAVTSVLIRKEDFSYFTYITMKNADGYKKVGQLY